MDKDKIMKKKIKVKETELALLTHRLEILERTVRQLQESKYIQIVPVPYYPGGARGSEGYPQYPFNPIVTFCSNGKTETTPGHN